MLHNKRGYRLDGTFVGGTSGAIFDRGSCCVSWMAFSPADGFLVEVYPVEDSSGRPQPPGRLHSVGVERGSHRIECVLEIFSKRRRCWCSRRV